MSRIRTLTPRLRTSLLSRFFDETTHLLTFCFRPRPFDMVKLLLKISEKGSLLVQNNGRAILCVENVKIKVLDDVY